MKGIDIDRFDEMRAELTAAGFVILTHAQLVDSTEEIVKLRERARFQDATIQALLNEQAGLPQTYWRKN